VSDRFDKFDRSIYLFFGLTFSHFLWASSHGLDRLIRDSYRFRQTQNAITSLSMMEGGPFFRYEMPVLGVPWALPFELPIYQWLVARFAIFSQIPLDTSGRIISILFFLGSLPGLYLALRNVKLRRPSALMFISLLLMSPLYLFWSRTFMIESTALFAGSWFLACGTSSHKRTKWLGVFFGALCSLVKLTTFPGFILAYLGLRAMQGAFKLDDARAKNWHSLAIELTCLVMIPTLLGIGWSNWADSVRRENPLAVFLWNENLTGWLFGTAEQRFSPYFSSLMYVHATHANIGSRALYFVAITAILVSPKFWRQFIFCLALFVIPPLIFTNLYIVHHYYFYACGLFLVAAMGWSVLSIAEKSQWTAVAIFCLTLFLQAGDFHHGYFIAQNSDLPGQRSFTDLTGAIQRLTLPREAILIYGYDWEPDIAYYARRRAVMDREFRQINVDPAINAALKNTERAYPVTALVVCQNALGHPELIEPAVKRLRLEPSPAFSGLCHVYARKR
jgi:hypothetical protein